MPYRSERFPTGELKGLGKAWDVIDELEGQGLPVRAEVLSRKSYRRQLDPATAKKFGNVNYVLQAVLSPPASEDGTRVTARYFIDESVRVLGELDLPGGSDLDQGGLDGLDPSNRSFGFGSTGDTSKDILHVFPPWVSSSWTEAGRSCMFFCGIEPPQRSILEEHPVTWEERDMRNGQVVFVPTPSGLETY